jgi:hypothetical protein
MRAHDRIGAQRCKGWLRLEFVFDLLHQGKARVESPVHHLLILPFIGVKPDERVEQAFLRFARTADARQDIRGEVRVDLIWIGVLGQVPFSTEIKAPELVPVRFADLVRDSLRHGDRCGIRLQFPEVSNLALLQIHFQAYRDEIVVSKQ